MSPSYNYDRNQEVKSVLDNLADEFQVTIVCNQAEAECFSGHCYDCIGEFTDYIEEEGDDDEEEYIVYLFFNCFRRPSYVEPRSSIGGFELPDFVVTQKIRSNWLAPGSYRQLVWAGSPSPVAEVEDNAIMLLVNLDAADDMGTYWEHAPEVIEKILREALPLAMNHRLSKIDKLREKMQAGSDDDRLIAEFKIIQEKAGASSALKEDIDQLRRNVEMYREGLVAANRQLIKRKRMLAASLAQKIDEEKVRKEFQNIKAIPEVEMIGLYQDQLHILTRSISIRYLGRTYELGEYHIQIGLQDKSRILIKNLRAKDRRDHPHVDYEIPCWGNITDAISEAQSIHQLYMLVILIIQFLKSYNPSGAYRELSHWPVKSDN